MKKLLTIIVTTMQCLSLLKANDYICWNGKYDSDRPRSIDEAYSRLHWHLEEFLRYPIYDSLEFDRAIEDVQKKQKKFQPLHVYNDGGEVYRIMEHAISNSVSYASNKLLTDVILRYPDGTIVGGAVSRVKKGQEQSVATSLQKYKAYLEKHPNYWGCSSPNFKEESILPLFSQEKDTTIFQHDAFPYPIFLGFAYDTIGDKYLIFNGEKKKYEEWRKSKMRTISGSWSGLSDIEHPYFKYTFYSNGTGVITYDNSFQVTIPQSAGRSWRGRYNKKNQMLTGGYDVLYKSTITEPFDWKMTEDSLVIHIKSMSYSAVSSKPICPSRESCATEEFYQAITAQCKLDFQTNEEVQYRRKIYTQTLQSSKEEFQPYTIKLDVLILTNNVMIYMDANQDMRYAYREGANDYSTYVLKELLKGCAYNSLYSRTPLPIDQYDIRTLDFIIQKIRMNMLVDIIKEEKALWIKAKKEEEERERQKEINLRSQALAHIARHFYKQQLTTSDKELWNDCYRKIRMRTTIDIYSIVDTLNLKFGYRYMPLTDFRIDSCDIEHNRIYCTFVSNYTKTYTTSVYFDHSLDITESFNDIKRIPGDYEKCLDIRHNIYQEEKSIKHLARSGAKDVWQYYLKYRDSLDIKIDYKDYQTTLDKFEHLIYFQENIKVVINKRAEISTMHQEIQKVKKNSLVIYSKYTKKYDELFSDFPYNSIRFDENLETLELILQDQHIIYSGLTQLTKQEIKELSKEIKKSNMPLSQIATRIKDVLP